MILFNDRQQSNRKKEGKNLSSQMMKQKQKQRRQKKTKKMESTCIGCWVNLMKMFSISWLVIIIIATSWFTILTAIIIICTTWLYLF